MGDNGGGGGTLTDSGLAPFDDHPASLSELDELAGRFVRLADRGVDQDAVTAQRASLAEAHWDGLAAPELRSAPQPVRNQAQEAVGALAWVSGPLWYWRDQIQRFNSRVSQIQNARVSARSDNWGLADDATDEEVASARADFEREQRDRWWEAYRTYIEDGSTTAAAMLREGPTEQHLALLRDSGVWRDHTTAAGSVAVFMPTWHGVAMERLADELSELVTRINDPTYRPTEEELERLDEMLEKYGDDEAFAYYFLTEIGPEGLLQLTGNLALMQPHDLYEEFDGDLAALVGSIQAGLGVALATATTRRGAEPAYPGMSYRPGQYELPSDWRVDLLLAGRQQQYLTMPYPGAAEITMSPYGYQLLGVLLQSPEAEFDTSFLTLVGGDMLDFERDGGWSMQGEGLPIWHDVQGVWSINPLKLNWIEGGQGNDGYDPVVGLLSALERNPDAAREFFTSQVLYDGSVEGGRLPRLDYLLTDRVWIPDTHERVDSIPGLELLGDVLVNATTEDPDQRSHRIVESIIYELATDEQAYGYPNDPTGQGRKEGEQADTFRDLDLIPPELRGSMADITTYYVDDMFFNLIDNAPPEGMPADWDVRADPRHTQMFLADLGKDPESRDQVATAAALYANLAYDYYLSPEGAPTVDERLEEADIWVSRPAGMLFGALDFGHASSTLHEQQEEDSDFNDALANRYFLAGLVVDNIPRVPGPVGSIISELMDRAEDASQADRIGDVNTQVGEIRQLGRDHLETIAHAALYRNLTADQVAALPDQLTEDGQPVPVDQWTAEQWEAWQQHISQRGSEFDGVADSGGRYDEGYDRARADLESYW